MARTKKKKKHSSSRVSVTAGEVQLEGQWVVRSRSCFCLTSGPVLNNKGNRDSKRPRERHGTGHNTESKRTTLTRKASPLRCSWDLYAESLFINQIKSERESLIARRVH